MPQVFEIPAGSAAAPNDQNGLYIWDGTTGLQYGTFDAFKVREQNVPYVPAADWMNIIETAKKIADQDGIPTIYVVRS